MNKATKRSILRWIHIILSIPIAGYIYGQPSDVQQYAGGVRFIFFPAMVLSGFWMWKGYVFALIGVALWLGGYRLSGFGAAVLSQVVLLIVMQIWFVITTWQSKRSALTLDRSGLRKSAANEQ